jgi:penicillin G amidase
MCRAPLAAVAAAVLCSVLLGGCTRQPAVAPEARAAAPPIAGDLAVAGVGAAVTVVRDTWGVPHIQAQNEADLFFAQGFVQAQDRLFQMDLWRRSSQGRLAEVLGSNFIERDAMTRRMQYRGDPAAEWASYGPDALAIATAFTSGINAWVERTGSGLPEEFVAAGWVPERWQPGDLLNRTDAFAGSGNARDEILRLQLVALLGPARTDRLLPALAGAVAATPTGFDPSFVTPLVAQALGRVGVAPFFSGLAGPVVGSNAWAVDGSRSETGAPILAADPHRLLQSPSLHYLVHLQAPGWNVAGATAPWLPGVSLGHNDRVAWGWTLAPSDTQDIHVDRTNPSNPLEVSNAGTWTPLVVETEAVPVKGRKDPLVFDRRTTPRRGIVVAVDSERHLAYSVVWRGFEPGAASGLGALALARAASAAELSRAIAQWKMPSAEFVYADREGHIARQMSGGPTRPGARPAAFVVSANRSGARESRIGDVLAGDDRTSVEAMKALQRDVVAWNAQRLVPLLSRLVAKRPDVEAARTRLLQWDGHVTAESADGALYARWEGALLRRLILLRIPPALADAVGPLVQERLVASLAQASPDWFDGPREPSRDGLLLEALGDALGTERDSTISFLHPLGVSERARRRFNIGPFALGGYPGTVLATTPLGSGRAVGPGLRMVIDLADWDRSVAALAPGQSGTPASPHYRDLAEAWSRGEFFPLPFTEAAVDAHAANRLRLVPAP